MPTTPGAERQKPRNRGSVDACTYCRTKTTRPSSHKNKHSSLIPRLFVEQNCCCHSHMLHFYEGCRLCFRSGCRLCHRSERFLWRQKSCKIAQTLIRIQKLPKNAKELKGAQQTWSKHATKVKTSPKHGTTTKVRSADVITPLHWIPRMKRLPLVPPVLSCPRSSHR